MWQTLFWSLAIVGAAGLLHGVLLLLFALLGRHPPDIVLMPRMQLLLALLLTIPLIQAGVPMLFGDTRAVALGLLTLAFPSTFLLSCFTLVWYHIYHLPLHCRGAHYVVQDRMRSKWKVQRPKPSPSRTFSGPLSEVPEHTESGPLPLAEGMESHELDLDSAAGSPRHRRNPANRRAGFAGLGGAPATAGGHSRSRYRELQAEDIMSTFRSTMTTRSSASGWLHGSTSSIRHLLNSRLLASFRRSDSVRHRGLRRERTWQNTIQEPVRGLFGA